MQVIAMFSMSAAEFSLYLSIMVIIGVLGLLFWTWTQFQDMQRHYKTLENLVYGVQNKLQKEEIPLPPAPIRQTELPLASHIDDYDSEEDIESVIEETIPPVADVPAAAPEQFDVIQDIHQDIEDAMQQASSVPPVIEEEEAALDEVVDSHEPEVTEGETLDSYFPPDVSSVDFSAGGKINYDALSRKELTALAEKKNIKGWRQMKKNELVSALSMA